MTSASRAAVAVRPARAAARFSLGYRPSLDGLRGISILSVMAYHVGLIRGGFLGVDIFFVLSGFLITSILVEEWGGTGGISFGKFYMRRALRLLPALVAVVIACDLGTVIVARLYWRPEVFAPVAFGMAYAAVVALFYIANWVMIGGQTLWILGHTWSLSIEEQFYLVWPLCLLSLLKWVRRRAVMLSLLALGAAASLVQRIALVRAEAPVTRVFFGTDSRFDALLVGCFVGLLASWNLLAPSRRPHRLLGAAAVVAAAVLALMLWRAGWREPVMLRWGLSLVALSAGVLIAEMVARPDGWLARTLAREPLAVIGRISYGLYLWHFPIVYACGALAVDDTPPDYPRAALAVGLTFLVAAASFQWIERPMLRLKRRFAP